MTNDFDNDNASSGDCYCKGRGNFSFGFTWRPRLKHLVYVLICVLFFLKFGVSEAVEIVFRWVVPPAIANLIHSIDDGGGHSSLPPLPSHKPQPPQPRSKPVSHPAQKNHCADGR
jgi:hypothetical protein